MSSNHFRSAKFIILALVCIYALVMLVNDGFMATDEYWTGITRYIPAQSSSVQTLVREDDVKSPLQILPMHAVAQSALALGVETPYLQYRLVIAVLGSLNLLILLWVFGKFADFRQASRKENYLIFLMLTLYFAAPFAFTRPMFEALAAPWLAAAAVFALRYDRDSRRCDLFWGVLTASVAFVLRQQVGFCALVFIILPLLKKNTKDFLFASFFGLLWFVLAGIPDYFLRGQFHFSLLNLTFYNFKHGGEYGNQPITFYPSMILVMSFAPFFIARYGREFLKKTFARDRSLWIILGLFVFLHSLFPQKWERFLITLIPVMLFILEPYLWWMLERWPKYRVRLTAMFVLNGILFFLASFFPPQKNLIGLSIYLDQHPEIKKLYKIEDTPEWITDSFILNQQHQLLPTTIEELKNIDWKNCDNALVIAHPRTEAVADIVSQLQWQASFPVNWIESVAYKLNPKNNVRRVQLDVYTCKR